VRTSFPDGAVLLIAYGGPHRREDVRPYLARILRGRNLPVDRIEEVARHYEIFGGRSPLAELTTRQAAALEADLAERGPSIPVHIGMRNWTPYLHEALDRIRSTGARRVLGIIMAPHQSYSSWDQYKEDVAQARARLGEGAPAVEYLAPWYDRPGFIAAQADRVADTLAEVPEAWRREIPLVFTAHSIPVSMASVSPYVAQITASARLVAERLEHPRWDVAYQSRSGDPRDPWLEPDVKTVIRDVARGGGRGVVVVPIGFVCDHIEVLYDLDTEARDVAADAEIAFYRARTVMDHAAFIGMLGDLIRERAVE
jgi:protoporphyrin/coproporphyrin ferrochelatase